MSEVLNTDVSLGLADVLETGMGLPLPSSSVDEEKKQQQQQQQQPSEQERPDDDQEKKVGDQSEKQQHEELPTGLSSDEDYSCIKDIEEER